jgi:hypothetical protein
MQPTKQKPEKPAKQATPPQRRKPVATAGYVQQPLFDKGADR